MLLFLAEYREKLKFKSLVEKSDSYCIFFYQVKPVRKFLYVSPSVNEVTGYKKKDFYDDPEIFTKLVHKEDFPIHEFQKLYPELSKKPLIMRWVKHNGDVIWTKHHYKNIYDKKGNLENIQIIVFDITEQKRSDFALIESQRKYKELFNNANEFIFLADFNDKKTFGNVIEANNYSRKYFDMDNISSVNFFNLISNTKILETRKIIEKVLEKKITYFETTFTKGSDDNMLVEINASYFKLDGKDVILFIARDISERKKAEYNLQVNQKLEAIGRLAGGVAHDFNNYLTAILGNVSLLKYSYFEDEEIKNKMSTIEEVVHRAKNLTNQLLTFSIGGSPIKEVGDLAELIKANANFLLRGTHIECVFNFAENIRYVEFDEGQINQVINNLIINSMQVMREGGIINISLENYDILEKSFLEPGKYVKFVFVDSGPGIPEEYLGKIFKPFFTTKEDGHGLGLSTSYSIIKKHGGAMKVSSESGKGAIFTIYLPATDKEYKSRKLDFANKIFTGKSKLLILEDNDNIIETLKDILSKLGYRFEFSKKGEDTIELYRKALIDGDPFDGVILDLTIQGGLGGKLTMKELRQINPKIKAIVSSGYSNDPIMSNYKSFGFSDIIIKPFNVEKISNVLYNLFERGNL